MFHTISKLFDKGGVEGMLMYNLRVNPFSSTMALNQGGLPDPLKEDAANAALPASAAAESVATKVEVEPETAPSSSSCLSSSEGGMLDLTDLIAASQLSMADLQALTICPQLNHYRAQIHNKGRETGPGVVVGEEDTGGTVRVGELNPIDFRGSHFFPAVPTEAPMLGPSVHSLTRDLTVIPFATMTEEHKEHTFANQKHAYFDGMAAMCAPTAAAPVNTLFNDGADDDMDNYADAGGGGEYDDFGNECDDAGNDADDCDEEGNYLASERRATLAPMAEGADGATAKGNTRMSMLQVADVNGVDDEPHVPSTKIHWDAVGGSVEITQEDLLALPEQASHSELSEVLAAGMHGTGEGGEYAFFDVAALMVQGNSNDWAGAKHWKRGAGRATRASTRIQSGAESADSTATDAATENEIDSETAVGTGGKAKKSTASKAKKAGVEIDFLSLTKNSFPAESLFKPAAVTKSGTVSTALLTQAAIKKQNESAENGEYFLPVDSKLQPKDLCRLFLIPRMVVPPPALAHLLKASAATSSSGASDVIWGAQNVEKFSGTLPVDDTLEDYGNDDNDNYDDDRFFVQGGCPAAEAMESTNDQLHGEEVPPEVVQEAEELVTEKVNMLAIDESKLVSVGRKVGKIDIGYSTVAKRINVKQLKVDIWQEIAQLAGTTREGSSHVDENGGDGENAPPAADFHATELKGDAQITDKSAYCDGKEMSFQGLVNDLAVRQKQKEVSVSFYFICLLHLANEKCLKITDNQDMDDLIVSKDH